ncbi:MAG TPA: hypothetical protein VFH03_05295 [Actinoplanes sp.]|nr:hypothetical protein [Actinoplanes sp.]
MTTSDLAWVPDACSLPTAERRLRLADFDELFATAVRRVEPVTPTHARLHLTGGTGLATTVRDLTARETECCSFFQFTATPGTATDGEALTLDIEVPAQFTGVLAALTTRASSVSASRAGLPASSSGVDHADDGQAFEGARTTATVA